MKVRGQKLTGVGTRAISLPRADGSSVALTLSPLPLGFHGRLRRRGLIPPRPPVRVARDSSGKPVRDEAGLAVMTADRDDAAYAAEVETYHRRVAVLVVDEALRGDAAVSFEASRPDTDDGGEAWVGYADQLFEELEAAGFAAGDLVLLCDEVARLSNLIDGDVTRARADFSSAAGPPT
ncbi:MAG: hypothetical protein AAF532_02835 [Planctomycetota bacterium]